ncbi:hypothetical protein AB0I81_32900 [Nonomuraea sp. NPDC050404]|uniref:hypothetical protein n=1 Tax=Nonomuraea sp. NPDC050404 TaxID=3155783 RepID=UPI00340F150F
MDVVPDRGDRFARLCSSSTLPMLSRVDPYGTLILTSQEMEQFISELEEGFGSSHDSDVKYLLQEILRLARECESQSATELHLEGD